MSKRKKKEIKRVSSEEIEQEKLALYEMILQQRRILQGVLNQLESGELKMSSSILKETTAMLRNIAVLLENMKASAIEAEENDPNREATMTPEQEAMMREWDDDLNTTGKPIAGYGLNPVNSSDEVEAYDPAALRSRYPKEGM